MTGSAFQRLSQAARHTASKQGRLLTARGAARNLGSIATARRAIVPTRVAAAKLQSHARTFADLAAEPEYASGDLAGYEIFHHEAPYKMGRGGELPELKIAYETWGELNTRKDNAVLLHCGMSASSHARSTAKNQDKGWWENFIGPGKPLDTNLFYIICSNNMGSCFGSSGPSTIDPRTGKPYGSTFPRFEVEDQVRAQFMLLDHLGIDKLHASVGASLGGMQSIFAAANWPDRVGKVVTISACAKSAPRSIAFRHAQRQAIRGDANFNGGDYYDGPLPSAGLRLARQIGTITYRSGDEWKARNFDKSTIPKAASGLENEFEMEAYLTHQGEKWVGNFDPNSVIWVSKAMDGFTCEKPDTHGKMSLMEGLKAAQMPALVIGVQTDVLFPIWQQKEIADCLRKNGNDNVAYYELDSVFGHDGFLLEQQAIGPAVKGHLEQEPFGAAHLWEEMAQSAALILEAGSIRGSRADTLRDIWRTLAAGSTHVETAKLRKVLKFVLANQLSEMDIDSIFDEHLPQKTVTLKDFIAVKQFSFNQSWQI